MKNQLFFFSVVIVLLLMSCGNKQQQKTDVVIFSDSLSVKHAEGFKVFYAENYKAVIVYSPWSEGTEYARYYLVTDDDTQTPTDGIKIKTPLKNLAATSVTHFEFLQLLHELQTVTGVCSPELIYNRTIKNGVESGRIANLGDAFALNVEQGLLLNPAAVMVSGFNQNDPYSQRVSNAGIPVLYNNEWMEKSLLARAEWLKFVAAFYNKEKEADSIFSSIENNYQQIREKANMVKNKPSIVSGTDFRGTWYVPGGNSFMGQLYADAGGKYFYASDASTGSLALNFETVLNYFSEADIWLNCSFSSITEMKKADKKYALFEAVKSGKVYNFDRKRLPSGANDFWESSIAHPDVLLADVIAVLHPEILPEHELVYIQQLMP